MVRTVPFQLYFPFPFSASNQKIVQGFVDREFNARHRGLRAVWQPAGNMSAVAGAILAGSPAPVVVSSCCGDWPLIAPFLEPLDAYFKKDNLDVAKAWTARQLAQFQGPAGLLGLPEDAARAFLGSPRWAMSEALEHLEGRYGGAEPYLLGPAGMAPAQVAALRELLVAPA
jgi:hypothetical protein